MSLRPFLPAAVCAALSLAAAPAFAVCGDGVVDGVEPCDDGNANDNDGCLTGCIAPRCGDGYRYVVTEECDAGANNSDELADRCRTDCTRFRCGDGILDTFEACDDGNRASWDGCSGECEVEDLDAGGGGSGGEGDVSGGGCGAGGPPVALVLFAPVWWRRRRRE